MTTGSARSGTDGTSATDPSVNPDVAIDAETKSVDRKLKGICRGVLIGRGRDTIVAAEQKYIEKLLAEGINFDQAATISFGMLLFPGAIHLMEHDHVA